MRRFNPDLSPKFAVFAIVLSIAITATAYACNYIAKTTPKPMDIFYCTSAEAEWLNAPIHVHHRGHK